MTYRQRKLRGNIHLASAIGMMFFGFGVAPAAEYGIGGTFLLLAFACSVVAFATRKY